MPFHFAFVPAGSHGDVMPFLGVAAALRRRGHRASAYLPAPFVPVARRLGVEAVEVMSAHEYRALMSASSLWDSPLSGVRHAFGVAQSYLHKQYETGVALSRDPDSRAIAGPLALGVRVAQETHGLPLASVQLAPASVRSVIEPPRMPGIPIDASSPAWLRRLTVSSLSWFLDQLFGPLRRFRTERGLAPAHDIMGKWINSPSLTLAMFPPWFAPPAPDWPQALRQTAFPLFDLEASGPLAPAIDRHLHCFGAPIVFTPGTAMARPKAFFEAALEACQALARPAVLLTRFADQLPSSLPDGIARFDYVPLSLLLPHAAALVHHGGIGTSSQGLAGGVPQLVTSIGFDQPDNARRLQALGVARELPFAKVRGDRMASQLETLLGDASVSRATQTACRLAAADRGIDDTCDVLEAWARAPNCDNGVSR